ncbi:MAG TPA: arylmalonate decarboxylase [Oceanospirillaceae bacterium]|nr:arylmalonate decarboxylase [Oceanospirillaceae bacterium]
MTSYSLPTQVIFDQGRHPHAKIGFVLLATEQTIEDDMRLLLPDEVGCHFTRAPIPDSITVETLTDLGSSLGDAARLILPDGSLDVISYACTSGSLVLGEEQVYAELSKGAPKAQKTCIIASVIKALRAVEAKKIVVVTPYLDSINQMEDDYLQASGFEVLDIQGMQLEKDSDMIRVSPQFIVDYAQRFDSPDADAVFISCGALRSIEVIDQLEQALGKPVITSNQATAWDTMRMAGVMHQLLGYGQLLAQH